jgi:hypothetical protein
MLGPDPPDHVVPVPVPVNVLGGDLGFADPAHARQDLHRTRPAAVMQVVLKAFQFVHPAGEVGVARRDLVRPDPLGRSRSGPPRTRARRGRPTLPGSLDAVLGRLPQHLERGRIAVQRRDDVGQEVPAGYAGMTEHVVHGGGTDAAPPGLDRDGSHRRTAGLQVQLVQAIEQLGDGPGRRRRIPLDRRHRSTLPTTSALSKFVKIPCAQATRELHLCDRLSVTVMHVASKTRHDCRGQRWPRTDGTRPPVDEGGLWSPAL